VSASGAGTGRCTAASLRPHASWRSLTVNKFGRIPKENCSGGRSLKLEGSTRARFTVTCGFAHQLSAIDAGNLNTSLVFICLTNQTLRHSLLPMLDSRIRRLSDAYPAIFLACHRQHVRDDETGNSARDRARLLPLPATEKHGVRHVGARAAAVALHVHPPGPAVQRCQSFSRRTKDAVIA
jgi:hypothetical protein